MFISLFPLRAKRKNIVLFGGRQMKKRLCMISLDAASQVDAERLFAMPNLKMLREEGTLCTRVKTVYPTITYPIHASLLTGCYPEKHGIPHNQPLQADTPPKMRRWYWEIGQIKAKTLHQAAREQGLDVASILWPVTGKNPYTRRNFPEILPLPGENAALKMLRYGTPLWVLQTEIKHRKKRISIKQPHLDRYAALLCESLYASRRPPDVLTVHLVDLDSMRHWHGTDSLEALQAMERLDENVGRIVQAVKKAGLYEETLFCIVSDHGHRDAPRGVLLDAVLKKHTGCRVQTLGMGAYIFGDDPEAAKRYLEENRERLCIGHIYDEKEIRALHGPENVKLAVDAMDGCCFIDEAEETKGEHGFALSYPQARVLWLLSGPGVKKNASLEEACVVDVAPTLAYSLGLSMPDCQGQAKKELFL